MLPCDLNCDMGEGIGNEEALMPYIISANIACGYHAGDEATMHRVILLAQQYGVAIGAHPSFPDKENFGRTEMQCTPEQVYGWVSEQINAFKKVADACGAPVHHVKPHGALYNMAAKDAALAKAIAQAVKDADKSLVLYGLSGSCLISEGTAAGLQTAAEVFADRTYQEDGSLTPRSQPGALITNEEQAVQQVLQMIQKGSVTTITGKHIPIVAQTVCIHGDGANAQLFSKRLYVELEGLTL
jgi:5-oxoprolinase (ATP-hydrolysing) subunit A